MKSEQEQGEYDESNIFMFGRSIPDDFREVTTEAISVQQTLWDIT